MNFSIEFLDQKFHLNKLKRYLNNMRLESIMIIPYGNILMVLGLGSGIMLEVHLLIIMVTFFMLITTILFIKQVKITSLKAFWFSLYLLSILYYVIYSL
jgi:hypothetical protein